MSSVTVSGIDNSSTTVRDTVMKVVEQVVATLETKHSATVKQLNDIITEQDIRIQESNNERFNKQAYEKVIMRNTELLCEISGAKTEIINLFNDRNNLRVKCVKYEQTIKELQMMIDTIKREYAEEQLCKVENTEEQLCKVENTEEQLCKVENTEEQLCKVENTKQQVSHTVTSNWYCNCVNGKLDDTKVDELIAYWSTVQDYTITGMFVYRNKHVYNKYYSMFVDIIFTLNRATSESQVSKLSTFISTILNNHPEYYDNNIGSGSNVYYWIQQQCNTRFSTKEQVDLIAQVINMYRSKKQMSVMRDNTYFTRVYYSHNSVSDKYYNEYKQLFDTASYVAIRLMQSKVE